MTQQFHLSVYIQKGWMQEPEELHGSVDNSMIDSNENVETPHDPEIDARQEESLWN